MQETLEIGGNCDKMKSDKDPYEYPIKIWQVIKHPSIFISLSASLICWVSIILKMLGFIKIGWGILFLSFIALSLGMTIVIMIVNEIKNQNGKID